VATTAPNRLAEMSKPGHAGNSAFAQTTIDLVISPLSG
jgi:hypothetical protein